MALMHSKERDPSKDSTASHRSKPRWGLEGPCRSARRDKMAWAGRLGRVPLWASLGQAPWAQLEVPGAPGGQ